MFIAFVTIPGSICSKCKIFPSSNGSHMYPQAVINEIVQPVLLVVHISVRLLPQTTCELSMPLSVTMMRDIHVLETLPVSQVF